MAYDHEQLAPIKQTDALEIGTQKKMIDAASQADQAGAPLNAQLTIRWSDLPSFVDENPCDLIGGIVEKIRKWMSRNKLPVHYLWVREYSGDTGEHWHLALHLPERLCRDFAAFAGRILKEPASRARKSGSAPSEIARSETGAWHLCKEIKEANHLWPGYWLASYLGKGEPSERPFREKRKVNDRKPVRGAAFDGHARSDKYDSAQGRISGTAHRKKRYDISKRLKKLMRENASG